MLPSTGYFKAINCPFYDNGTCERPYCHFRHVKKESRKTATTVVESGIQEQSLEEAKTEEPQNENPLNNGSEFQPSHKVTYNPTPIADLEKINKQKDDIIEPRKKHIPVPYTPRKPASLLIKRPINEEEPKPFIYIPPTTKYLPGSTSNVQIDPYKPAGEKESSEKYLPGSTIELVEYKPVETHSPNKLNYIPSDRNNSKKKVLEYKPAKLKSQSNSSATYQPTPKTQAPCFSSDEDEPDTKKRKISEDLNKLDELGVEFDLIDQILDEEKHKDETSPEVLKDVKLNKEDKKKTDDKTLSESKDKRKDKNGYKHKESKTHSSHKKSSHKSSSREKDKKKDKHEKQDKSSSKSSKSSKPTSKHDSRKHRDSKEKEKKKSEEKKPKHKSSHRDKIIKSHETTASDTDFRDDELCEEISEEDEDAIALECKKIFEEYVPTAVNKPEDHPQSKSNEATSVEYIPSKKRISRTVDKNIKVISKEPIKPDYKENAAQKMAERLTKVKEYHEIRKLSNNSTIAKVENTSAPSNSSGKIRIAHVPYAGTLINAKKHIPQKPSQSETTTIVQTIPKGSQRVAHIPNEKFIDRPGVLEPLASKIPANIRSTYLNMMIDECLKIYITATDAYARAQFEELNTSKKCKHIQIYKNSAVLAVSRLRKEILECNGVKKSGLECSKLQNNQSSISGTSTSGNVGSWSIEKNKKRYEETDLFSGTKFYNSISKWVLTEEQLQANGFPRPHPSGEKGRAMIYAQNKQKPPKGIYRTCCRCKKEFTVDKKGLPSVKEECIYHPNNKYRYRGEVKYQCCSQDGTSDGCCIATSHVYEYVDYENLKGYVRTMHPEETKSDYGVYSLDCEMCYTTHGLDLTRITVINSHCKVVYETLIKPLHPIVDYNTRYSGITEEQMAGVKTTILEVQASLLTMFNSKTILVGHSLESDFKALKLIHDTVIDTSVLYPHKMGPPYKRALRNLSSEYLKKIIQNSVDGHDSAEDAMVCMELIQYRLREDLKTR